MTNANVHEIETKKAKKRINIILIATAIATISLVALKVTGVLAISWLVATIPLMLLAASFIALMVWFLFTLSSQLKSG